MLATQFIPDISLTDEAYSRFKTAILESVFAPGAQHSENELALRFGTSRTPVHEAALRLQEEGLIKIIPKKGIIIAALTQDDMREIYDVIIAIESAAAEAAADLPDDKRLILCQKLREATDKMGHDLTIWSEGDAEFHRLLVNECGNMRFARIMQTVNDQSHRARTLTLKLRPRLNQSAHDHAKIIDAIESKDSQAAFQLARTHRLRAKNDILPLLTKFGLNHL